MDQDNVDMLMVAVTNNRIPLLKNLLDKVPGDAIQEALEIAVGNNADPGITRELVAAGGKVTESLATIVDSGSQELLQYAMGSGADPNIRSGGLLPVERAYLQKNTNLIGELLPITDSTLIKPQYYREIMTMTPLGDYDAQVRASALDLETYSEDEVRGLAKMLQVSDLQDKDHSEVARECAKKLIYVHSQKPPAGDRGKCARYSKKLSENELEHVRNTIYQQFIRFKDSVPLMTVNDLADMLWVYDELCFSGDIKEYMSEAGHTLTFKTEGEPTFTTEGICSHLSCGYTITIPIAKFDGVSPGETTIVAGHECKDQLECLQRVLEHEMVHLIIFMLCSDGFIADQHGELFMNMVGDLFAHTDHRHHIF